MSSKYFYIRVVIISKFCDNSGKKSINQLTNLDRYGIYLDYDLHMYLYQIRKGLDRSISNEVYWVPRLELLCSDGILAVALTPVLNLRGTLTAIG